MQNSLEKVNISVILPTYNRPQLVKRALESLNNQDSNLTAEIFLFGDDCPHLDSLDLKSRHRLFLENLESPNSGNPARAVNKAITLANSEYTIFLGDDDYVLPHHFENYYRGIKSSDSDWAYCNSWISLNPFNEKSILRDSYPAWGRIGHSEIIVKTAVLKDAPYHSAEYGHDWTLIQWLLAHFPYHKIKTSPTGNGDFEPSYIVNWDTSRPKTYSDQ